MPLQDSLSDVLIGERFSAILLAVLAGMGLLLAALGLYGVISYSVGQRKGEIGLRMALGARPVDILRLIVGQGASLAAAGLALGAAGAWAMTRLLANSLYGIDPSDLVTFVSVALLRSGVTLFACLLPARRATRVDPMAALRSD